MGFVSFDRVEHIFRVRVAFPRVLPSLVLFNFRACPACEFLSFLAITRVLYARFVSSRASPMIFLESDSREDHRNELGHYKINGGFDK